MKVYLVKVWNGEAYEDSYEWIDKVFLNEDKAKEYVKSKNKEEQKRKRPYGIEKNVYSLETKEVEE